MDNFASMLKYLRVRNGLSQAELAKKLDVSRSRIGMYETGGREPGLETLERIADFFNVDMNFLLGKEKPPAQGEGLQLTEDEASIILLYREAPKEIRMAVDRVLGIEAPPK